MSSFRKIPLFLVVEPFVGVFSYVYIIYGRHGRIRNSATTIRKPHLDSFKTIFLPLVEPFVGVFSYVYIIYGRIRDLLLS